MLLQIASELQKQTPEIVMQQPGEGQWSVIQIIVHLNSYCQYYLPRVAGALQKTRRPFAPVFTSGWLGNYFTRLMQPDANGKITKKMKAATKHLPVQQINTEEALGTFIAHQQHFLKLLGEAMHNDINYIRLPISIMPFLTLKLGDIFCFLSAHQKRHAVQITNTLNSITPHHPPFAHQASIT